MPEVKGILDTKVTESYPKSGLYTSDQGRIYYAEKYELIRVTRASATISNNVGVYYETGRLWGTTYAGNLRVRVSISKAMLNFAEARLALGGVPGETVGSTFTFGSAGREAITANALAALLGADMTTLNRAKSFYPEPITVSLEVNPDANMPNVADSSHILKMIFPNMKLNNLAVMFDASGLITSGPLEFIGTEAKFQIVEKTT